MSNPKRPPMLSGQTIRMSTGCGHIYVTVNTQDEEVNEVFVRLGKAGGCASSQTEALGRLITLALRAKVEVDTIIRQLTGIGCHIPAFAGGGRRILSCADAVAKCLKEVVANTPSKELQSEVPNEAVVHVDNGVPTAKVEKWIETLKSTELGVNPCPDCGCYLSMEEGCEKCATCGYTRC